MAPGGRFHGSEGAWESPSWIRRIVCGELTIVQVSDRGFLTYFRGNRANLGAIYATAEEAYEHLHSWVEQETINDAERFEAKRIALSQNVEALRKAIGTS